MSDRAQVSRSCRDERGEKTRGTIGEKSSRRDRRPGLPTEIDEKWRRSKLRREEHDWDLAEIVYI
jgi:hypothetical protein